MHILAVRLSYLRPLFQSIHENARYSKFICHLKNSKVVAKVYSNLGASIGILILISYGIWLQRPARISIILKSESHLPVGLFNPKNYCYLNALLQALSSCPLLLISLKRIIKIHPQRLASRLVCILESLRCSTRYLEQNNLISVVQNAHLDFIQDLEASFSFDPTHQQDVHELFTFLCEKIFLCNVPGESELISQRGLLAISDFANSAGANPRAFHIVHNCASKIYQPNEKIYDFPTDRLPIKQLDNFQVITATQIFCSNCSFSGSPSLQPESGIFLYLDDLKEMNIEEALKLQFSSVEPLKDILCPICTGNTGSRDWIVKSRGSLIKSTCYKQVKLVSLPNSLVFFVQRISFNKSRRLVLSSSHQSSSTTTSSIRTPSSSVKKGQHMKFNSTLNMTPFTISQSSDFFGRNSSPFDEKESNISDLHQQKSQNYSSKRLIYNLRSLIVHQGQDCNSGHYVAIRSWKTNQRRNPVPDQSHLINRDDVWLSASDESIVEISRDNVFQSQAYVLFYERDLYSNPRKTSLHTGTLSSATMPFSLRDDCNSVINSEYDFDQEEYMTALYAEFANDDAFGDYPHFLGSFSDEQVNRADFIKNMAM